LRVRVEPERERVTERERESEIEREKESDREQAREKDSNKEGHRRWDLVPRGIEVEDMLEARVQLLQRERLC
jgi:hypothetical protein